MSFDLNDIKLKEFGQNCKSPFLTWKEEFMPPVIRYWKQIKVLQYLINSCF